MMPQTGFAPTRKKQRGRHHHHHHHSLILKRLSSKYSTGACTMRSKIIGNDLIENVVEYQSCMFYRLPIIFKRIRSIIWIFATIHTHAHYAGGVRGEPAILEAKLKPFLLFSFAFWPPEFKFTIKHSLKQCRAELFEGIRSHSVGQPIAADIGKSFPQLWE